MVDHGVSIKNGLSVVLVDHRSSAASVNIGVPINNGLSIQNVFVNVLTNNVTFFCLAKNKYIGGKFHKHNINFTH